MSIHDEMIKMKKRRLNNKQSIFQEFMQFRENQRDKEIVSHQIAEYEEYLRHKKNKEVDEIIKQLKNDSEVS